MHALIATTRAARRQAAALGEASAETRRLPQRDWSAISTRWGLTLRSDPGHETRQRRSPVIEALVAVGLGEDDLDDLIQSLCAAYEAARALVDDKMLGVLEGALPAIGFHLASERGPKAAGVVLS